MRYTIFAVIVVGALRADDTGPWDLQSLRQPPKVTWVDDAGAVRRLFYEAEPLGEKPTRVFAYLARPENANGKSPAMVLVHGGGGTAFREWAELWAKRGYVAIAMDLGGCGEGRKRLPDGIPDQGDVSKFPREPKPIKEIWSYHAVAAVIRAVSLLTKLPEVDADRIGITGISWGGYLTCIVMGLDDRLKAAVPVYGCGFLYHNSAWVPTFEKLAGDWRKEWVRNFDPSKYVGNAKMPVLFVNGTNDFAYPLDSYQKTYRLVKDRNLSVQVNLPHGHKEGWAPVEIGLFIDSHLKGGKPLAKLDRPLTVGEQLGNLFVRLPVTDTQGIQNVSLNWTTDLDQPWQKRKWQSRAAVATIDDRAGFYSAELPKERPLVYFFTAVDDRKANVSTEHYTLEK